MLLTRWDPLADMVNAFDSPGFFGRLLSDWTPLSGTRSSFVPAVEAFSRDGDLVVRAELPGIDPEKDVDITVQDGYLQIRGQRQREHRREGDHYFRSETLYGSFERQFLLPDGVNADDIKATYEGGILEVVVPKAAELTGAKKIPIEVGGHRKALAAEGGKK